MPLNKVSGNMYDWVTHTFNMIKGECPHGCHYCYMKRWGQQPELRFDEAELKTDLGSGKTIFVGSSCDMFAVEIEEDWIQETLWMCERFPANRYVFQTKNPANFYVWNDYFHKSSILGTTIETNRFYKELGNTPRPEERARYMNMMKGAGFSTFVTIEPIMDFDHAKLVELIKIANPSWVNIGANSMGGINLPEPGYGKVNKLIHKLKDIGMNIRKKKNLGRLIDRQ